MLGLCQNSDPSMPISPLLSRGLIGSVLLSAAVSSTALTLGRSRGAALIGRPLDVAIAITLDSSAQAGELCPGADVFQGDTRVEASRISVAIEPARGQEAVVRVRSSQVVDEPVVTIYLRLGCNQQTTRRYVLLSEEPAELAPQAPWNPASTDAAPAAALAAPPVAATSRRGSGGVRTEPGQAAPTAPSPARGRSARAAARSRRDAAATAAEPVPTGVAAAKAERALTLPAAKRLAAGASRRPRLQLDMVELGPEREPGLRASSGLTTAPTTSEQVRNEAAALWRSINAQPQDVLRDLQRVQALEEDVKGLRSVVAGNDRTLGELRQQLNEARQERSLTLAAIALLTLLLAAMVVTWWLRRGERAGAGEWWRRGDPAAAAATAAAGVAAKTAPSAGGRVEDADLQVDESMFDSLRTVPKGPQVFVTGAPPPRASPSPQPVPAADRGAPESAFSFQSSQATSMRMVKAEELVDIQQQADFFMSIGQTEQAIELLETHIRDHAETSALVWLDLLAIYRALKRRDDYELLRGDFQRVFNAEVPGFDQTPTVSGGLEDYPRALSRISALWPSPKVMDLIEESIFRKPGSADGEPFDLEAYRELVMLYNLGREVVEVSSSPEEWTGSDAPGSSFFETAMQPLSVGRRGPPSLPGHQERARHGHQEALDTPFDVDSMMGAGQEPGSVFGDPQLPRPSPRLGLDIDLTEPAGPSKPAPLQAMDTDGNVIDFELSEPGPNGPDGGHRSK